MRDEDLEALLERLDALEAREQIRAVISRYPRGVDRCEPAETQAAFWPDGQLVTTNSVGQTQDTINELIGQFVPRILALTHHLIGNIIIDLRGEEAFTESYAIAYHRTHATPESNAAVIGADNLPANRISSPNSFIVGLRYLDRFQRRDGTWKILERRMIYDWTQISEVVGMEKGGLCDITSLRGLKRNEDASHDHLANYAA